MAHRNLRFPALFAAIFLLPCAASAGPPSGTSADTQQSTSSAPTGVQEFQSLGINRQTTSFSGIVLDINDIPVPHVQVKLFIDGETAGTSLTDGNGYYDIKTAYNSGADETVILWFATPDRSFVPKEIVLRESKASQQNGIISPCVPRAEVVPGHQFRVYLFDLATRIKELSDLDCLP